MRWRICIAPGCSFGKIQSPSASATSMEPPSCIFICSCPYWSAHSSHLAGSLPVEFSFSLENGELCPTRRSAPARQDELPSQMIERRAETVEKLAKDHGPPKRRIGGHEPSDYPFSFLVV